MDNFLILLTIWLFFSLLTGIYLRLKIYNDHIGLKFYSQETIEIILASIFWPIIVCLFLLLIIVIGCGRFFDFLYKILFIKDE
jgi:hypothetical protein